MLTLRGAGLVAIRAMIAAIWRTVFSLPSELAVMMMPRSAAIVRRMVTATSRAMITIATQAASRSRETRETRAPMISSLSASGSISLPKVVTEPRERAKYPSRPSVSAARAKTAAARASPLGVSPSRATTTTGTARMRRRVRALGRLSGNTGFGVLLSEVLRALDADVRDDPVHPARQPPGAVAEQHHHRRHQQ